MNVMETSLPAPGASRPAAAATLIPMSVRVRLSELSRRCGSAPAYLDAGQGTLATWAGISQRAADWSRQLPPGTVVALRVADPVAFCRAYLAGLAAGVCLAPLDPRATAAELAALLDTLEAVDLVVDDPGVAGELRGLGVNVWLDSPAGLRQIACGYDVRLGAHGIAALLPTSGTTGRPKLVPLTQPQLLRVAALVAAHHELTPADRGYCPLPLFHVNAQVVGVLATLVAGSSLVVDDRFHRSRFWASAEEFRVTWLNLVPAILGILSETEPPPETVTRRVRFARSASAPLPVAVHDRFEARSGIGVLETYGMTEAASQIAASPLAAPLRRAGSAGLPTGVRLRVVDGDHRELPAGQTGAVELRGRSVIHGYLGPRRTLLPARGRDGWLRTGDQAYRDAQGFVYLTGRQGDLINRGGEKFHPREVEEVLLADRRIRAAAVIGRPHQLLGEEPVAYVVAGPGATTGGLSADLLARCERSLSPYKRPAAVRLVAELPSGRTGKLDRRALRAAAATAGPQPA